MRAVIRMKTALSRGLPSVAPTGLNTPCLRPVMRLFSSLPEHIMLDMPALSPTMEKGNLARWLVKPGDKVNSGDVIAEVETDKATVSFETMDEGYVARIFLEEGASDVPVGTPAAILVDEEADIAAFADYIAATTAVAPVAPVAAAAAPAAAAAVPAASAASAAPDVDFIQLEMPALSPTMERGTIAAWIKQEGDEVLEGDIVAEVETDKATVAFESMEAGFVAKILLPAGEDVAVGTPAAILVEEREHIALFKDYNPVAEVSASPPPQATAAPVAAVAAPVAAAPTPVAPVATPAAPAARTVTAPITSPDALVTHDVMTQVAAARVATSKFDVPHIALTVDIDVTQPLSVLQGLDGVTLGDFAVKASCASMREVPSVNSAFLGDRIRQYHSVNVNQAVATDSGLVFPLVNQAEKHGIKALATARAELQDRAQGEGLYPHEYDVGTFTIADFTQDGPSESQNVLVPPQACSLSLGRMEQRVVKDPAGGFKTATFVTATLSCDHRSVDGAVGAEWLKSFQRKMENPLEIIL